MDCLTELKRMKRAESTFYVGLIGMGGVLLGLLSGIGEVQAFDGPYVGVHLGHLHQTTNVDAKQDPGNPNADMNSTRGGRGMPTLEAAFGWGKVFGGCYYGGIEGKVDLVTGGIQKVAEDVNFIYSSGRKGFGVGALLRLGYLVSPTTLLYAGLGVKSAHFSHNMFEKTDQIAASFSKRSSHLLTEVGIETKVQGVQNLRFRFGYSFMPKKGMTRKATDFPTNHMYHRHGVSKTSVAEHAIKVGLVYQF